MMENQPGTCGMIFPRHPDDERRPMRDDPCLRPAIGTTEDGARVCGECAVAMMREGFRVDFDPGVVEQRIAAVREIALARGDRRILGDVNLASRGLAAAVADVLATWNRRAETP